MKVTVTLHASGYKDPVLNALSTNFNFSLVSREKNRWLGICKPSCGRIRLPAVPLIANKCKELTLQFRPWQWDGKRLWTLGETNQKGYRMLFEANGLIIEIDDSPRMTRQR